MEKSYTMTRAEIVETFKRWREDVLANPADFTGDPDDHEGCANCFLTYAGFGGPAD